MELELSVISLASLTKTSLARLVTGPPEEEKEKERRAHFEARQSES